MGIRRFLVEFFRWDARAILAMALGLAVLIGFAMAATSSTLLVNFDFGGASVADKDANSVAVMGGITNFPKTTAGGIDYGWTTAGINEFSDKSITNKIDRDYNAGPNNSVFKLSGLDAGSYRLSARVGSSTSALSTKLKVGSLTTSVTTQLGSWQTANLNLQVDNSGTIEIVFSSANGTDNWGICGLGVYKVTGTASTPTFAVAVTPATKTIPAGDTAVFSVGVTPLDNYGSAVSATVTGLVSGMTAEFSPPEITPPATMELRIYTTKLVPPTNYQLVLTVTGQDELAVQKTSAITLSLTAGTTTSPNQPVVTNPDGTMTDPNSPIDGEVDLPPRSAKELGADFDKIDSFAAEQRAKALQKNNFLEMTDIGQALSASAPSYQTLPEPKTTTEMVLQKLVTSGIISTTTDAAPPVQAAPKAPGFWQNLFEGLFKTAS